MERKLSKYHLFESKERFQKSITEELNKNLFNKKFNLSGSRRVDGVEIYNSVSLITFKPHLGPFIKLRVTYANRNEIESNSTLILQRVNGLTFYVQYWFSLAFIIITLGICTYQIGFNNYEDNSIIF